MIKSSLQFVLVGLLLCGSALFAQEQANPAPVPDSSSPDALAPQHATNGSHARSARAGDRSFDAEAPSGAQDRSSPTANPSGPGGSAAASDPAPPGSPGFRGKFRRFAKGTFRPKALVFPAVVAGLRMAHPPSHYPKEWRVGPEGFGRNFGDALARHSATQTSKFLVGTLLHEDPRYTPASGKGFFGRSFHAVMFTVIDKSDPGRNRIAFSNLAGAVAGGFVGNAYLPAGYSNASHAEVRSGIVLATFAGQNLAHEFSPELKRVARKLHVPFVHE